MHHAARPPAGGMHPQSCSREMAEEWPVGGHLAHQEEGGGGEEVMIRLD